MSTAEIITLAGSQLQDIFNIRWTVAGLVNYLNLGVVEIINLKPDAYPVRTTITLAAGPTQSLGNNALALIDVIANMGTDGNTQGNAITTIDKTKMDDLLPDWMTHSANATVAMAITDSRDPKTFYVYPPQPSGGNNQAIVSVVQSERPTLISNSTDTFPLDDSYIPACVDYLIYRSLAEETTIPNAQNKANFYMNKFYQDLGLKNNQEKQNEVKGQ